MTPTIYQDFASWMTQNRPAMVALVIGLGLGLPLFVVYGKPNSAGAALFGLFVLVVLAVSFFSPGTQRRLGSEAAAWGTAVVLDGFALMLLWLLVRSTLSS